MPKDAGSYTGTVRYNDLEGGFLELVTDGGDVYRLSGQLGGAKAGQRVKVSGRVERGGFGIHMSGPALAVDSLETL
jgi:hypothetical protein